MIQNRYFAALIVCALVVFSSPSARADEPRVYSAAEIARIQAEAVPVPFPDPADATLYDGPLHMVYKFDPADLPVDEGAMPPIPDAAEWVPPKAAGPTQITDTTSPPYSASVHIYMKWSGYGWGGCSGTFFGDTSTVITAGHCLYNHDVNQLASEIVIIPGDNDGVQPFGSKNGINWATNNAWINFEDYRQDWGVIKVGAFSGPYSMGYVFDSNNSFYYGNEFNTAGYPADMGYPGNEMWWELGNVDYVESRMIRLNYHFGSDPYYCIPGQSGSSIYYQDGSLYQITAILTLASCHSVRLDQSIVNYVQSFNNGCDGCFIDDSCFEDGEHEQGNPCNWCDVDEDAGAWTTQNGTECDDGFFCNGDDTCQGGECVGEGDPCDEGESCDENLNACMEGDGDDDDDDAGDCSDWLSLIYEDCGLSLISGGESVPGQEALDACNEGASVFECVGGCVNNDNVDSCAALAECLVELCDVDTAGGGDDDDDDNDGGSCGF